MRSFIDSAVNEICTYFAYKMKNACLQTWYYNWFDDTNVVLKCGTEQSKPFFSV